MRVLVVEDDPDLARVLTTVFERHGAVVINARTGHEETKWLWNDAPRPGYWN